MALYKFKVKYEDENFSFDVDILSNQTFEDFHNAILKATNFDNSQLASFYISDDKWNKKQEITLIDMTEDEEEFKIPVMKDSIISKYINNARQKLIYVYDFMLMHTFKIELTKILPQGEANIQYPIVTKINGKPPLQLNNSENYGYIRDNFSDDELNDVDMLNEFSENTEFYDEEDFGNLNDFEDENINE